MISMLVMALSACLIHGAKAQLIVVGHANASVLRMASSPNETKAPRHAASPSVRPQKKTIKRDLPSAYSEWFDMESRLRNLPAKALKTIASIESGFNPYAVYDNGRKQSFSFGSKKEALDYVKSMIAKGNLSLDLGLMQVNWKYHGKRFQSVEDAFDPRKNIAAAAEILDEENKRYGNIIDAVASYHSPDNERRKVYLSRFIDRWYDAPVIASVTH